MKKHLLITNILLLASCLRIFGQGQPDTTQSYINATLRAIRTIVIKSVERNSVSLQLSKDHPLVVYIKKFDEKNVYRLESYSELGTFDNYLVCLYPNSTIAAIGDFKISMENLEGSKDNLKWVTMSSVKGQIVSGEVELKGNYSANGYPVFFEETKIIFEDNDSLSVGRITDGSVCNFNNVRFQYENGSWIKIGIAVSLPIIDVSDITSFTDSTARVTGYIFNEGGSGVTERGVCFGTSQNPTVTDNKITEGGQGRGGFESVIRGLKGNTVYFVRAYATNQYGTAYSNQVKFTPSTADEGAFTYSGKTYPYKKIGDQIWMTRNLAYLPDEFTFERFITYTIPEYSVADISDGVDVNTAKESENYKTYGVLYNWPAAVKACPTGWHLPSDGEWKILEAYLGMLQTGSDSRINRSNSEVANKLKETGSTHWKSPNEKSSNSSGFKALPGGFIGNYNNRSEDIGYGAFFWTSTETDSISAWSRKIGYHFGFEGIHQRMEKKNFKYSVRCIKD